MDFDFLLKDAAPRILKPGPHAGQYTWASKLMDALLRKRLPSPVPPVPPVPPTPPQIRFKPLGPRQPPAMPVGPLERGMKPLPPKTPPVVSAPDPRLADTLAQLAGRTSTTALPERGIFPMAGKPAPRPLLPPVLDGAARVGDRIAKPLAAVTAVGGTAALLRGEPAATPAAQGSKSPAGGPSATGAGTTADGPASAIWKYAPLAAGAGLGAFGLYRAYQNMKKQREEEEGRLVPKIANADEFAAKHPFVAGFLAKCAHDNRTEAEIVLLVKVAAQASPEAYTQFDAAFEKFAEGPLGPPLPTSPAKPRLMGPNPDGTLLADNPPAPPPAPATPVAPSFAPRLSLSNELRAQSNLDMSRMPAYGASSSAIGAGPKLPTPPASPQVDLKPPLQTTPLAPDTTNTPPSSSFTGRLMDSAQGLVGGLGAATGSLGLRVAHGGAWLGNQFGLVDDQTVSNIGDAQQQMLRHSNNGLTQFATQKPVFDEGFNQSIAGQQAIENAQPHTSPLLGSSSTAQGIGTAADALTAGALVRGTGGAAAATTRGIASKVPALAPVATATNAAMGTTPTTIRGGLGTIATTAGTPVAIGDAATAVTNHAQGRPLTQGTTFESLTGLSTDPAYAQNQELTKFLGTLSNQERDAIMLEARREFSLQGPNQFVPYETFVQNAVQKRFDAGKGPAAPGTPQAAVSQQPTTFDEAAKTQDLSPTPDNERQLAYESAMTSFAEKNGIPPEQATQLIEQTRQQALGPQGITEAQVQTAWKNVQAEALKNNPALAQNPEAQKGLWDTFMGLDRGSQALLAIGLGVGAIGLINAMTDPEAGAGSALMAAVGIGVGGLTAAHNGMMGDAAKKFVSPVTNGALGLWEGMQGKSQAGPAATAAAPAADPAVLAKYTQMPVPQRMQAMGLMDGDMKALESLTSLSRQYEPEQLSQLLAGTTPEQRAELATKIKANPAGSFFGIDTPGFSPDVSEELLGVLQQQQPAAGVPLDPYQTARFGSGNPNLPAQ
jgi:hypothetical protein